MSKIQEALQRLQSSGSPPAHGQAASSNNGKGLATVTIGRKTEAPEIIENTHGVVIEIDHAALRDAGLIAPAYHEQLLADEYRDIKRPLIANVFGKRVVKVEDGNLIMVTSAVPGEGKTFTSLNLAISIAQEKDLTVLLVDADVAKPHVSDVFGVGDMDGLLDVLDAKAENQEALVVPTDIPGLSVLPAGAPRANATELLSSSRMEQLMLQLSTQDPQRIVIFDTPPLLQTSESKVLSNLAGQIVLVVKAASTTQGAVGEALRLLGSNKAVNLVLNQARKSGGSGQYEYGYGIRDSDQAPD